MQKKNATKVIKIIKVQGIVNKTRWYVIKNLTIDISIQSQVEIAPKRKAIVNKTNRFAKWLDSNVKVAIKISEWE